MMMISINLPHLWCAFIRVLCCIINILKSTFVAHGRVSILKLSQMLTPRKRKAVPAVTGVYTLQWLSCLNDLGGSCPLNGPRRKNFA